MEIPDRNRPAYRLPTEAEWEYACRAGTTAKYSFGNDPSRLGTFGWFEGNSKGVSHPVGEKRPNDFGIYDMHGNVWEWCSDWSDDEYYKRSPPSDPPGASMAAHRVNRGGGLSSSPPYLRSAFRSSNSWGYQNRYLGLRLARSQAAR